MKKFLLSCAVGAIAALSAFGADFTYGYCSDNIGTGLSEGEPDYWLAAAIKIPGKDVIATYGNVTLSEISVGMGSPANKDIEVFLSYGPQIDPFYTQKAVVDPGVFNNVKLDKPYSMTEKDLYIGYIIKTDDKGDFPIGVDKSADPTPNVSMYFSSTDRSTLFAKAQNVSSFGNICIRGIFSVNKENYVNPSRIVLPDAAKPNTDFSATLHFANVGTNSVNSISVTAKVGDDPEAVYDIDFPAVESGAEGNILIEGLKASSLSENMKVSMKVVKVNGVANAMPVREVTGSLRVLSDFYNRPVVIEEGTGTECGYCPRGYVAMEEMKEKYDDSSFIGIAVHTYNSSDPMYCRSYISAVNSLFIIPGSYLPNYPCANVNRTSAFDPSPELCQTKYDEQEKIAFQKVDFTARYTNPHYEELEVMCDVTSLSDMESHSLGLAVVTTEDGVGPYKQANNYAGGRLGPMGGFERKPTLVNLIYNDVARTIVSWKGNTEVMPESLKAGVPAKAESLYITTDGIDDLKNSFITVLLIDTKTRNIVNAKRIAMPEANLDNVDPASVGIVVEGDTDAEYYTLDGLRVNDDYLAPGLYIKRQNGKSTKIIVK